MLLDTPVLTPLNDTDHLTKWLVGVVLLVDLNGVIPSESDSESWNIILNNDATMCARFWNGKKVDGHKVTAEPFTSDSSLIEDNSLETGGSFPTPPESKFYKGHFTTLIERYNILSFQQNVSDLCEYGTSQHGCKYTFFSDADKKTTL